MAGVKPDPCSHSLHVRILYLALVVLALFSLTCFVVTYVFVSQLKTELGQKCTCPDGDMLFEITVLPIRGKSVGTGYGGDVGAGDRSQIAAQLGLAASEPSQHDLRGLHRVRRAVTPTTNPEDINGVTIEAYARLPITISVSDE